MFKDENLFHKDHDKSYAIHPQIPFHFNETLITQNEMRLFQGVLFFLLFCCLAYASERRIALLVRDEFKGEISFAYRLQAACQNLHWKAEIVFIEKSKVLRKKSYDFVINLVPGTYRHPKCKNYLAVFHPKHHLFKKKGALKKEYRSYDGYLTTFEPPPIGHKESLSNSQKFPHFRWYPSAQKRPFQIVDPTHLFFICCIWGNRFEDEKFRQLLGLLDKEPYTRFYGKPLFKSLFPQSYLGKIPYDEESLMRIAAAAGVTLILHSNDHNAQGIPSGRIFEAAAASTVIICDQNAFVQEHFGDSVLYIDTQQDSNSILSQIQSHMKWIQENKTAALEKAEKAYSIYQEKFLLEDQLLKLEKFHEQASSQLISFIW